MQGATPCAVVAAPAAPFRSAPPCRGRPTRRDAPRGPPCFDPRPHAGGDATCRRPRASQLVSIRAPMQGATPPAEPHISTSTFRSAPPCRGRLIARSVYQAIRLFRSAPPCRGRPPAHQVRAAPGRFDPRPHAGGDGLYINTGAPDGQFRSAPLCRGRPRQAASACKSTVSIRAPMQGATIFCPPTPHTEPVSIRAPMQGATGCCRLIGRHVGVSIHAPMQGATRR